MAIAAFRGALTVGRMSLDALNVAREDLKAAECCQRAADGGVKEVPGNPVMIWIDSWRAQKGQAKAMNLHHFEADGGLFRASDPR